MQVISLGHLLLGFMRIGEAFHIHLEFLEVDAKTPEKQTGRNHTGVLDPWLEIEVQETSIDKYSANKGSEVDD